MYELSQLSHLDTILLRETNIDNVIGIRAEVEALRVYAVNIGKSKDKCQEIAIARIKSERRAGQMLLEIPKRNGARPADAGFIGSSPLEIKGMTPSQRNSWQWIARLPDDIFERTVLERFQSGDDITTQHFYRASKIHIMRQRGISTDRPQASPIAAIDLELVSFVWARAIDWYLNGGKQHEGEATEQAIEEYKAKQKEPTK